MQVVDQTELVRKFNFRSVITAEDDAVACDIIKNIVADGNYFTNSPKFQTKENIFARPEPIWLKYRMSFLMSLFMYLGREAKVSEMMAWSFMTNLQGAEDREKLWHNHWHPKNPNSKMFSGVYYLHIPSDVKDLDYCGTEIAPNGAEQDGKYFITPTTGHWIIYPSETWHRPGIVQSSQYRFVLAADIEVHV
jgi:hypothetical protein